ncbi:MAG: VOC family protein [Armatimonadota bacterium]|nr:MAG: VOC family protein [Armatimonadota bacterium]
MPNTIVHFEIPAQDMNRLKDFYSGLFGWKIQAAPGMDDFMMINAAPEGEGINGALMKKRTPHHSIINYVSVESVADYAEKVIQLGGQVVVPKTAVPRMGHFALCVDPEGNPVGLWADDPNAA